MILYIYKKQNLDLFLPILLFLIITQSHHDHVQTNNLRPILNKRMLIYDSIEQYSCHLVPSFFSQAK
jgi:hypothetical protein